MCITEKGGDSQSYPQKNVLLKNTKTEKNRQDENQFSSKKIDSADFMKKQKNIVQLDYSNNQ